VIRTQIVRNFASRSFTRVKLFQVYTDLITLKGFVIDYNRDYNYDMTEDWDYAWTFPKSLLFTVTIMTTIGYGHISPVTFLGKMYTILYALIGMPMLLIFMNSISDTMAEVVKYAYSRICCRWCRVRRRDAELPPGLDRKSKSIMHDEVGKETYMPTDLVLIPIMVNLIIIFMFLFGGAILFSSWEDWRLGSAFYFCFITLSTIGLGDMVPERAFLGAGESVWGALKMAFTVSYCVFGIMLITLALNLMQEQVMEKVSWVAREIGMTGDGNTNEEVVKITKNDRLRQTPADMTGNELDFNEKREQFTDEDDEEEEQALHENEQEAAADEEEHAPNALEVIPTEE